ncbi:MAG: FAD-dependent oxidoreductase [Actinomycetota bacterium]
MPAHAGVPPRSWWLTEALTDDPGAPAPALAGDTEADVLIVGGGYTGMWTAHALKRAKPDLDIVLLEQDICGGGPSGRNGGFANDLWEDIDALIGLFGEEAAIETAQISERSMDEIGPWCDEHGIDAWWEPADHMGVSCSPAQDGLWRDWMGTMQRLGVADGHAREITHEEMDGICRSPVFREGYLLTHVGMVQPARLARGIRRVLLEQGVRIYEQTPVRRFTEGPPAAAETPGGSVRAAQAVLGINAWARQWKQFHRTILPRASYIALTAPAPDRLEEIGWTGGQGIYDLRSSLHYLRTTPDGRIAFGAASSRAGLGTGMGHRLHYDEASVRNLVRDLHRMFPNFKDVPIEAAWGGPIDVSGYHVPFFGSLVQGNVHYGLGFTGGGVGPCHMGGKILAGLVLGTDDEYTRLPLVGYRPKKFPVEPFLSVGAFVAHEAIVRTDDANDFGRRPNPLLRAITTLPRKFGYNIGH